jgi:hypothetical protein
MSKITTARAQAQEQRRIPYQPYAERGVATFASVLPARITITVGNDAALSTSDHFQIIFRSSSLLRHCSAKRSNAAYTNDADSLRSIYLLPQSHYYLLRLTNGRNHHESIINSIKTRQQCSGDHHIKKKSIHPLHKSVG